VAPRCFFSEEEAISRVMQRAQTTPAAKHQGGDYTSEQAKATLPKKSSNVAQGNSAAYLTARIARDANSIHKVAHPCKNFDSFAH
jgi:hypothetical protein